MKKLSNERLGETFIMIEVMIFAFFPVLANYTTKIMPPILFAGGSMIIAAMALFLYLLFKRDLHKIKNIKALKYILGVTLFVVIIPSIFIYTGTSQTSSINTAILLQTEILFTFLIVGLFTHEKITLRKILAALLIAVGAITVLYNGKFEANWGDLLIIVGVASFPIGNIYAKKALKLTSPAIVLFVRGLLGGVALIFISLAFEKYDMSFSKYVSDNILFLLLNGVVIYCITKLLWYEGFKRMDISKSIPMGMSHPAFTMVYAYIFLQEVPSLFQLAGFVVIMLGILIITFKSKESILVEVD